MFTKKSPDLTGFFLFMVLEKNVCCCVFVVARCHRVTPGSGYSIVSSSRRINYYPLIMCENIVQIH